MGAIVPQQAIRAGLVDEFVIHLIPVLLGEGKRLSTTSAAGWTWSARRSSRRPRASPTCASAWSAEGRAHYELWIDGEPTGWLEYRDKTNWRQRQAGRAELR